ncbi:hypothetical protein JW766_01950 [Candidatus Dojkabacteria bacterium]|nr:hypothetical protein [Candidatus Dojkabacteria bacterium]
MEEQTTRQQSIGIDLWGVEAKALNMFYGTNSDTGTENADGPGFIQKTVAALMVVPSFVLGRSGILKEAQGYAEMGVNFKKGINEVNFDSNAEYNLAHAIKRSGYMAVVGLILTIPSASAVLIDTLKYPDMNIRNYFMKIALLALSTNLLNYGALTWLKIASFERIQMVKSED